MGGNGVDKDEKEAVTWFVKSAEQGHAEAQYFLGLIYIIGKCVDKDKKEALKWFRKAAEQGHAKAKEDLRILSQ